MFSQLITATSDRFARLQKSLMSHIMTLPGSSAKLLVTSVLVHSVRSRNWWGWDESFASSLRARFKSSSPWVAGTRLEAQYLPRTIRAICGPETPARSVRVVDQAQSSAFPPRLAIASLDDEPEFSGVASPQRLERELLTWAEIARLSSPPPPPPEVKSFTVDVLIHAFLYLPISSVVRCREVNRSFREAATSGTIWRDAYMKR